MTRKLKSSGSCPEVKSEWLSRSDTVKVFEEMGHPISRSTLDQWRIPKNYLRPGKPRLKFYKSKFTGRVRYRRDDVVKFIEQHYR